MLLSPFSSTSIKKQITKVGFFLMLISWIYSCERSKSPTKNKEDNPHEEVPRNAQESIETVFYNDFSKGIVDGLNFSDVAEYNFIGKPSRLSLSIDRRSFVFNQLIAQRLDPDFYYKIRFDFKKETSNADSIFFNPVDVNIRDKRLNEAEIHHIDNYLINREYSYYIRLPEHIRALKLQFSNHVPKGLIDYFSFSVGYILIEKLPKDVVMYEAFDTGKMTGPWIYDRVYPEHKAPPRSQQNNWTELTFSGAYSNMRIHAMLFEAHKTYEITYDLDPGTSKTSNFKWMLVHKDPNKLSYKAADDFEMDIPIDGGFKKGRNRILIRSKSSKDIKLSDDLRINYIGEDRAKVYIRDFKIRKI